MGRIKPYYEAAKIVARDEQVVCCVALCYVAVQLVMHPSQLTSAFNKLYLPEGGQSHTSYFGPITAENKEARILALLFAQEVADEGGLRV